MVALAQWIEAKEPDVVAENRVWDFCGRTADPVGKSALQVVERDWEKSDAPTISRRGDSLTQKDNERWSKEECEKLLQQMKAAQQRTSAEASDLKTMLRAEDNAILLSFGHMALSEGIQAGYAIGKYGKIGYRFIRGRVKGWLGLGGRKMSDYADVMNRGNFLDARNTVITSSLDDFGQAIAFQFTKKGFELSESRFARDVSDAVFHSGASAVNEIRSGVGLVQARELKAAQKFSRLNTLYGDNCR